MGLEEASGPALPWVCVLAEEGSLACSSTVAFSREMHSGLHMLPKSPGGFIWRVCKVWREFWGQHCHASMCWQDKARWPALAQLGKVI